MGRFLRHLTTAQVEAVEVINRHAGGRYGELWISAVNVVAMTFERAIPGEMRLSEDEAINELSGLIDHGLFGRGGEHFRTEMGMTVDRVPATAWQRIRPELAGLLIPTPSEGIHDGLR